MGLGDFSIMMPFKHLFGNLQVLKVTLFNPHFVDFVILPYPINLCPSFSNPVCYSFTGLLVILSLHSHTKFKAFLMRSSILLVKLSLPCVVSWIPPLQADADLQTGSLDHRTQNHVENNSSAANY